MFNLIILSTSAALLDALKPAFRAFPAPAAKKQRSRVGEVIGRDAGIRTRRKLPFPLEKMARVRSCVRYFLSGNLRERLFRLQFQQELFCSVFRRNLEGPLGLVGTRVVD